MTSAATHPDRRAPRKRRAAGVMCASLLAAALVSCSTAPPPSATPPPPPGVARQKVVDGNGAEFAPSVSDDGNIVSFISTSSDIVADPAIDPPEVYVLNRATGVTTPLGRAPVWGTQGLTTQVSGNGRYVVFSTTDGLSPADNDGFLADVYRYDRTTATSTLISTLPDGGNQFNYSYASPDTSTVVVLATACGTSCSSPTFGVWRDGAGISAAWNLAQAIPVTFSSDGRYAATQSVNPIVPSDTNGTSDWYVFDFALASWTLFPGASSGLESLTATVADNGDLLEAGFGVIKRFDRANPAAPPTTTPTSLAWLTYGQPSARSDANGLHALSVQSATPSDPSTASSPSTCTWNALDFSTGTVDVVQTVTAPIGTASLSATVQCFWYRPGASANWRFLAYPTSFSFGFGITGPQDGIWLLDRNA